MKVGRQFALTIVLCTAVTAHTDSAPARSPDGTTALQWAVHEQDVDEVRRLIGNGADVNATNNYGVTAMSEAAATGNTELLRVLLEAGADVESPNPEGQTALMAVARTGNVEAAKLLLRHGANVNAIEQWGGQSALIWAVAQRHPDMVKLLIARGADVDARAIVRDWQRRVTAEGRPKDMNRGGLTPLLYAAREGCLECAKHLLDAGADIDLADPDRTSPLLLALLNLRFDVAMFLIERGADVNKWDLYGQSPLYVAIDMSTLPRSARGDLPSLDQATALDAAQALLRAGANPNLQLKVRPPFRHGTGDRLADPLLGTGATPLLRAARGADIDAVRLLLEHKALVDLPTAEGVTPLMAAAGTGDKAKATRGRDRTEADAIEVFRMLLAAGANAQAMTVSGETALHSAAQLGWNEMVKVVLASGIDIDQQDERGLTPLDYAYGRNPTSFLETQRPVRKQTAELLRALGARLEHPDRPPPPPLGVPTITTNTTAT